MRLQQLLISLHGNRYGGQAGGDAKVDAMVWACATWTLAYATVLQVGCMHTVHKYDNSKALNRLHETVSRPHKAQMASFSS